MDDVNAIGPFAPMGGSEVFTVGHSTMPLASFMSIIQKAEINVIADVRSSPFSRRYPHFSQKRLRLSLKENNIKYVFLGEELGGRPKDNRLFREGVADYEKMALTPQFHDGISRVSKGAATHRVALMCSEHNPLDCHRCLLVGRALAEIGLKLKHILYDGRIVTQTDVEERLLADLADDEIDDLFLSRSDRIAIAYKIRVRKVAFRHPPPGEQAEQHHLQDDQRKAAE
jgi:uncharacterized protein (DUF488 family)